jgi:hypothetical protein
MAGFISDVHFTGGDIGFVAGNQQYTFRDMTFTDVSTAIHIIWNWGMIFSQLQITACKVGIQFGDVDTTQVQPQGVAVDGFPPI